VIGNPYYEFKPTHYPTPRLGGRAIFARPLSPPHHRPRTCTTFVQTGLVVPLAASGGVRHLMVCGRQARPHQQTARSPLSPSGSGRLTRNRGAPGRRVCLLRHQPYEASFQLVEGRLCCAYGADVSADSLRGDAPVSVRRLESVRLLLARPLLPRLIRPFSKRCRRAIWVRYWESLGVSEEKQPSPRSRGRSRR
jgi:hypothetical protein